MKFGRLTRNGVLFVILFIAYGFGFVSDNSGKEELTFDIVLKHLNELHFAPQTLNDDFSRKAFDLYLENLDYGKRFLVAEDIDALKKYELLIDDQINNRKFEFFEMSLLIIDERIEEAQEYYRSILANPFDFTVEEEIETDGEKIDYAASKEILKDRWRKSLKFQTMLKLHTSIHVQDKAKVSSLDS